MKYLVVVLLCVALAWSLPNGLPSSVQLGDLIIPFDYNFENPLAEEEVHPLLRNRILTDIKIDERVINGSPATQGQFPWQAALFISVSTGTVFCGGSLITSRHILTAAHCAQQARAVSSTIGGTTSSGTQNGKVTVTASAAIVHPQYSSTTLNNDVAVITLTSAVSTSNYIRIIERSTEAVGAGVSVTVSGWGRTTDNGGVSTNLYYANMQTISNAACRNVFGNTIVDSTLCAQGATNQSPCNGDSGGPLVIGATTSNPRLVGVVSFVASGGCSRGLPSGYVRVSELEPWIRQQTGGL